MTDKEIEAARYDAADLENRLFNGKANQMPTTEIGQMLDRVLPYLRHLEKLSLPFVGEAAESVSYGADEEASERLNKIMPALIKIAEQKDTVWATLLQNEYGAELFDFAEWAHNYLIHLGTKRPVPTAAVSAPVGQASPEVVRLFEAAWDMMVEQQAGPEGWSMAKRWAFDKLSAAMEPFRTEYGDELDLAKIGVSTPVVAEPGGWVPVGERLPEPYQKVLLLYNGESEPLYAGQMETGGLIPHENGSYHWSASETLDKGWISHWLPLPTPPTQDAS